MKRVFALLLVTMLTVLAMTACGTNNKNNGTGNGSNVTDNNGAVSGTAPGDNAVNDGGVLGGSGSTSEVYPNNGNGLNGENGAASSTPANNGAAGSANGTTRSTNPIVRGTEDVIQGTGNAIEDTGRLIRGASYEQMLRNAWVNDTDGYLYDYENAMTPGTRYF